MRRRTAVTLLVALLGLGGAGAFFFEHRATLRLHWHLARLRRSGPEERAAAARSLAELGEPGLRALEGLALQDEPAVPATPEAAVRESALAAWLEARWPAPQTWPVRWSRWPTSITIAPPSSAVVPFIRGPITIISGPLPPAPPEAQEIARVLVATRGLVRPPAVWTSFTHRLQLGGDLAEAAASVIATDPQPEQALACLEAAAAADTRPHKAAATAWQRRLPARAIVRGALASPHAACRARAKQLLEEHWQSLSVGDRAAFEVLLRPSGDRLSLEALYALAREGDGRAVAALFRAARARPALRTEVARGLAALRDVRAIALLVALHDSAGPEPDPAVAWSYAALSGLTGHCPDDVREPWGPWLAAHRDELPEQVEAFE